MADAPYDLNDSLGYLVNRTARRFARALESRLADHEVALAAFPVLVLLSHEEGLTQTEMARRLNCEQPTMANTLKRMARDGLVRFAPDPASRRRLLVFLTERGRALWPILTAEARAINAAASATLSAQEVAQFKRMLGALVANLAAGAAQPAAPDPEPGPSPEATSPDPA